MKGPAWKFAAAGRNFGRAQEAKSASVACFIGAIFLFAGFVRALKSHEPSNSWHQLVKSIFVKLADGAYLPDERRASNLNFRRGNFVFSKPPNPQDSAPPATLSNFCPGNGISRRKSRPVPDDHALENDRAVNNLLSSRALLRDFDSLKPRIERFVAFVFLE